MPGARSRDGASGVLGPALGAGRAELTHGTGLDRCCFPRGLGAPRESVPNLVRVMSPFHTGETEAQLGMGIEELGTRPGASDFLRPLCSQANPGAGAAPGEALIPPGSPAP